MKKSILFLAIIVVAYANTKKTDAQKHGLKGKVKQVTQTYCEAVEENEKPTQITERTLGYY